MMFIKQLTTTLFCLVLACFVLAGCDNDNENDHNYTNYFKIGFQESKINEGNIFYYGNRYNATSTVARLIFTTGNMRYHREENKYSGIGNFIIVTLISKPEGLTAGTYYCVTNLEQGTSSVVPWTFIDGFYAIDAIDGKYDEVSYVQSGHLTITKNNNEYEVSFVMNQDYGTPLRGYYKGELNFYDFS